MTPTIAALHGESPTRPSRGGSEGQVTLLNVLVVRSPFSYEWTGMGAKKRPEHCDWKCPDRRASIDTAT